MDTSSKIPVRLVGATLPGMNNLKQLREDLSLSAHALCTSQGDTFPLIGTRRYKDIENGKRQPTLDDAKCILFALNINRSEFGQAPLKLADLGLETQ